MLIVALVLFLPNGLVSLLTRRGVRVLPPGADRCCASSSWSSASAASARWTASASIWMPARCSAWSVPTARARRRLINVISGLYAAGWRRGRFRRARRSAAGRCTALARLGINRTFQSPKPFLSLTVLGERGDRRRLWPWRRRAARSGCAAGVDGAGYGWRNRAAGDLNSAQQKTLDLARALATAPRMLLVDELAAGLNPAELLRMATGCARWRSRAWRCWWWSI